MALTQRLLALTAATLVCTAAAGCKIQPVDQNRVQDEDYLVPIIAEGQSPVTTSDAELGPAATTAIKYLPPGHAGQEDKAPGLEPHDLYEDEIEVQDRWRIGFPPWERGSQTDSPYDMSAWWDPYHLNVFKGDYPLPGTQNTFINFEVTSLTRWEHRRVPTPSSVFPRAANSAGFFGKGEQQLFEELLLVTADIFQGETSFKPVDWRFFIRGAFDWNLATSREHLALRADPGEGTRRYDNHAALQQAFFETTLASVSDKYDVIQLRVGTQLFTSDFKGFMFFDEAPGVRLFGNADDNKWNWNVAAFGKWEKDTNTSLNTWDSQKQDIFIANVYRQDVLEHVLPASYHEGWRRGLQASASFHWFRDNDSVHYDENNFLVRPQGVGTIRPNENDIRYLGLALDGHVRRLNITGAYYRAWGEESFNQIAQQKTEVDAQFAALELSIDKDWMRFRVHGLYQSGDNDPFDSQATGFDAIYDNPVFAGGEFGFWNRNTVRLTGSAVGLVQRFSLLNSLRSSKDQGQPNYVNPGLVLGGVGFDAALTPHMKVITNASYLRFDSTETLEYILNQDSIGKEIGYDLSMGVIWRPGLTDNVIVKTGISALVPAKGFRTIYSADTLYAFFGELILTW